MKTPDYYLPIMPYLIIDNATAFIDYIKKVFNAKEESLHKHDDGSVMHAEFSIGKAVILFTDSKKEYKAFPGGMFLVTSQVDELYANGLAYGGTSSQEPGDRDYGRSAGFMDPFGNQWWLCKTQ